MKTEKYFYGITFTSSEIDLNKIRCMDLFAIVYNKINPLGGEIPGNKEISFLIMNRGVKIVEIIRNRENKYLFDAIFYY